MLVIPTIAATLQTIPAVSLSLCLVVQGVEVAAVVQPAETRGACSISIRETSREMTALETVMGE
jgi:hypothetical protein